MLIEIVFDVDVDQLKLKYARDPELVALAMGAELEKDGYGSPETDIVSVRPL